jgi:hypothetical protein
MPVTSAIRAVALAGGGGVWAAIDKEKTIAQTNNARKEIRGP